MTKIWCTICHKTDFGVDRPTQQHVLDHIGNAHKSQGTSINNTIDRERWHQHQNDEWENRRRTLEQQLETLATEDGNTIDMNIRQQYEKHMEVYDDDEESADEGTTNSSNINASAGDQAEAAVGEQANEEVVEAAKILMSMSQAGYAFQELEAASALEMLIDAGTIADAEGASTQQTGAHDTDNGFERKSSAAGSLPRAYGTQNDPMVISSDDDTDGDESEDDHSLD